MALLSMAIFSTAENKKDEYLEQTLGSLYLTVDFSKHRLGLSINSATKKTEEILADFAGMIQIIERNETNIGTAEAINKIWRRRLPGENAVKMDDDVIIYGTDWLYLMEESIRRDPTIGQIGLKRRDLIESPWNPNPSYKSELTMLPHEPGEKWIVVEEVNHVMGTCQMYNSKLLDKIGYLYQPGLYGFDDSLASVRSKLAGFRNVFLIGVDIEHIDRGDTNFQKWKVQKADEKMIAYLQAAKEFTSGKRPLYYNPFLMEHK